jgi:twitching motility two-component system response regulator PilG
MAEKKEILIVEDEEILLKLQSLLLSSRGYLVKGVSSGRMALESLANRKPDLVVLDISQDELDAFEICRQIKSTQATRDIPVIIMARHLSSEDLARGETVGASCCLAKPFKSSLLVNAVYTLLFGNHQPQLCMT